MHNITFSVVRLTSLGVNYKSGNHLVDLAYSKGNRLKNAFLLGKEDGITRLEVTISSEEVFIYKYYQNLMEQLSVRCNAEIFYKTPYKEQWRVLEENVKNSLLLADKTDNIYYFMYYLNNLTNKTIGITAKCANILEYVVQEFSYKNLPMHVLEYTHNGDNINSKLSCYII